MFDTLLLRPSLHCSTPLHFTTLHPTTLHYTYRHFTSSHLHFTTLSFSITHLHFLSFYFTSHHITDLIPKTFSKKVNPFTALKNFSPFHFTLLFILFYLFVTGTILYNTFPSSQCVPHIFQPAQPAWFGCPIWQPEAYKLWSCPLYSFYSLLFIGPNIFLRVLFSDTLTVYFRSLR
jgi:hypothetical protein